MDIKFDILDYIGKYKNGVVCLISLLFKEKYYEGIFYYTDDKLVISIEDTLETKIGTKIENWEGYDKLMLDLVSRVIPKNEIINRLDDIDFKKWGILVQ